MKRTIIAGRINLIIIALLYFVSCSYNNIYDYYEYEYVKNISWNSFAASPNKHS